MLMANSAPSILHFRAFICTVVLWPLLSMQLPHTHACFDAAACSSILAHVAVWGHFTSIMFFSCVLDDIKIMLNSLATVMVLVTIIIMIAT